MPFTTLDFIAFFAIVFFGYYLLPKKCQWPLLLVASYVFYAWTSPLLVALLFATTAISYASAVSRKPWVFWTALCSLIGLFLWGIFQRSFGWIVPIGLSFYCLQTMGYIIDVHWEVVEPERNFFKHALFVGYFPQIMQGPIGNYGRLAPQLFAGYTFDYEKAVFGIQRAAWGFFKKMVIANCLAHKLAVVWNDVYGFSGFGCWGIVLIGYAIQLYADFSGYMDIACGCSQMLGIRLDENFNCPYFAKTVPDFWRRWHMTLSEWFKTYLFYPILRTKTNTKIRKLFKSKFLGKAVPTTIALVIVWATTGLWHGADWGYVGWGVYYGFFMILAIWLQSTYDHLHSRFPRFFNSKAYVGFQMIRTFAIVCLGYAIFKPANIFATAHIFSSMRDLTFALPSSIRFFVIDAAPMWAAVFALFVVDVIHYNLGYGFIRRKISTMPLLVRYAIYVAGLIYIINFGYYGEGFSHFEYFKF